MRLVVRVLHNNVMFIFNTDISFTCQFFHRFATSFWSYGWLSLRQWYSTKWHVAICILATHTKTSLSAAIHINIQTLELTFLCSPVNNYCKKQLCTILTLMTSCHEVVEMNILNFCKIVWQHI